jgi:thymidylate synthase (FAD)
MVLPGDPPEVTDDHTPTVHVLDHGYVRLINYMGSDLDVVRAARVSHDADWRVGEDTGSDARLINYLWKNRHTSPFESVTLTFEVKAPIFVFRQWHRHRTWSYNEVSARYTELPDEYYVPAASNVGTQSTANKQGREKEYRPNIADELQRYRAACEISHQHYKILMEAGWPRELARGVLPVATYSRMFATVNLLNLFRFLDLRADAHAQYEIREYAQAMIDLVRPVVPVCMGAWQTNQK